jgi:UDP-N-acetylmuramate--alanine ligase
MTKNLADYKKIHFIGIGGISMSSLAEILLNRGYSVAGSDSSSSAITDKLSEIGIKVAIGQKGENIAPDTDLAVYTAAVSEDNPELKAAREMGIDVVDRAELVGMMMLCYKHPVSVAGTHGKTTTSSMVSEIFLAAGVNPTISIGGMLPSIGGNYHVGERDYFVLETCEYKDSFLKFNPHSAIILNIDRDHTDYFKTMEQMYNSFNTFVKRIADGGFLVINNDIKDKEKVIDGFNGKIITYGKDSTADWYAEDISYNELGYGRYTAVHNGEKVAEVELSIPGEHNVYNSLAALALTSEYGLDINIILSGIKSYTGTDRRFQYKGSFNGVKVIDDYAHHPTEIKATIGSARKNDINKLWICFQPHTYTRTHDLLDEFADALSGADKVVLVDIYASREKDTGLVSSADLQKKIAALGTEAYYIGDMEDAKKFLSENCSPHDMLITMGAGDVFKLGESIVTE